MPREGEGEEGVCMHERKLVVATTMFFGEERGCR